MRPSFLTGLALFMNGPQLTQLFADLRFTEKVLRESKHTEENPLLIKLFGTAPEEILIEILSQLDGYDLLRCQRVSRYFHNLIHHSKQLRYKILLAKAHCEDGPRRAGEFLSSSAARLSLLQTHIDGWRNLRYSSEALTLPLSSCRHFAQGVLAWASRRVVHVFELPSTLRGTVAQRREFRVNFEPVEIFVNPTQDLLILIQYVVQKVPCPVGTAAMRTKRIAFLHFKTLSNGRAHPQATRSVPLLISTPDIEVRCCGNLLALAYPQPQPLARSERICLDIVDWKQGKSLMKKYLTQNDFIEAPFFLTRDMVLTCRGGVLCDYLVIYDISSGAFKEIISLTVGGVMERGTTRHMTIQGSSPAEATSSSSPFTIDDDCRAIHILVNANERLWDDDDPQHTLLIDMTVPVHHFLCLAEAYKRIRDASDAQCDLQAPIPLEKWSVRNAVVHVYRGPVESTPMAIHGSRIATILGGRILVTEDFRPDLPHWAEDPTPNDPSGPEWKALFPPGLQEPNLQSWYRTQHVYRASNHVPHLETQETAAEILMDDEHIIIIKENDTESDAGGPTNLVVLSMRSRCGNQAD